MAYTVVTQTANVAAAPSQGVPTTMSVQVPAPSGSLVKGAGTLKPTGSNVAVRDSYPELDGSAWNFSLLNNFAATTIDVFVVCE